MAAKAARTRCERHGRLRRRSPDHRLDIFRFCGDQTRHHRPIAIGVADLRGRCARCRFIEEITLSANHAIPTPRGRKNSSTPAVVAALVGDVLVALAKSVAAIWTGSSAMTSEAIHSYVDAGNDLLLLYGIRRAGHRPDLEHPLGYGRELYFWSFIVALLVFALGAGFAFYEGVDHLRYPEAITHPGINYAVLGVAFVLEGWSWLVSLRQFDAARDGLGFYAAFRASKDPPSFMVLFENSAALLGLAVAAIGTFTAVTFHQPMLDGAASIAIGLILGATALLLVRESKSLLIGERADPHLSRSILAIAAAEPFVTRANGLLTVQLAPDQILAALSLEFADVRTIAQVEQQVIALE